MKKLLSIIFGISGLLYGTTALSDIICCLQSKQCGNVCCPTKGCNEAGTGCATEDCASGIFNKNGQCCKGNGSIGLSNDGDCMDCSTLGMGYIALSSGECGKCSDAGEAYGILSKDGQTKCAHCPTYGYAVGGNDYCTSCPDTRAPNSYGECVPCTTLGYGMGWDNSDYWKEVLHSPTPCIRCSDLGSSFGGPVGVTDQGFCDSCYGSHMLYEDGRCVKCDEAYGFAFYAGTNTCESKSYGYMAGMGMVETLQYLPKEWVKCNELSDAMCALGNECKYVYDLPSGYGYMIAPDGECRKCSDMGTTYGLANYLTPSYHNECVDCKAYGLGISGGICVSCGEGGTPGEYGECIS